MLPLYAFFETASFLLGIFAALYFGSFFLPNPLAFLTVFFVFRTFCFYLYFRLLLERKLPLARFIIEGFLVIFITLPLSFLIWLLKDLQLGGAAPFSFLDTFGLFYYILIPLVAFLAGFVTHRVLKLEFWLN